MTCPSCKSAVEARDRFCPKCGFALVPGRASKQAAVLSAEFDLDDLTRLRAEKNRLNQDLQQLLVRAGVQPLAPADQAKFDELRHRFDQVSQQITKQIQYLAARKDFERRQSDRRESDRRKQQIAIDVPDRRKGGDRRHDQRRSGIDRRQPFG